MSNTQRYFIELCYDGAPFNGWQVQPNGITVQQKLNEALTTLLREPIETLGCGRTDTGVHARQFYAHFDAKPLADSYQVSAISDQQPAEAETSTLNFELSTPDSRLIKGINALLPYEISVKRIFAVHAGAHARFDATLRSYEYHMHFEKDPFLHRFSWLQPKKPDVAAMNEAAEMLLHHTDFSCFSKSNTQTFTNNCKVSRAEWTDHGNRMVFHISADRFLRNMVRAIVGTLLDIGTGKTPVTAMREILDSKNRSEAGVSVPAKGLFLTEVVYPYV